MGILDALESRCSFEIHDKSWRCRAYPTNLPKEVAVRKMYSVPKSKNRLEYVHTDIKALLIFRDIAGQSGMDEYTRINRRQQWLTAGWAA